MDYDHTGQGSDDTAADKVKMNPEVWLFATNN